MLSTGRPIGTLPLRSTAPAACQEVVSTVASVGPYRLCSLTPSKSVARSYRSSVNASPPQNNIRRLSHRAAVGSATNAVSWEGTKCATVIRSRRIRSARYAGSRCSPGAATTSAAPVISGHHSSHTEASKPNGVLCSMRSCGSRPNSRCAHIRWLANPPCVTTTPFGRPVEPDVYITYAACSGPGTSPATGSADLASPSAAASAPSSTTASPSGNSSANSDRVITHTGRQSASMSPTRSAGYSGSTGR